LQSADLPFQRQVRTCNRLPFVNRFHPRAGAATAYQAVATSPKPQRFRQFPALSSCWASPGIPPPSSSPVPFGNLAEPPGAEGKLGHLSQTGGDFRNRRFGALSQTAAGFQNRLLAVPRSLTTGSVFRELALVVADIRHNRTRFPEFLSGCYGVVWGSGTPRFALPAAPPVGVVGDCHRDGGSGSPSRMPFLWLRPSGGSPARWCGR
jgi:hypothetical protein